jgi:hypothetical protein
MVFTGAGGCSERLTVQARPETGWIPKYDETPYSEFNADGVGETGLEPATPGPPDERLFGGSEASSE